MLATRRPIKLPCSRSIGGKRNDTKASFLHKTEGAPLCSAQACCAVEDGLNMGCRSCEELAMARSTSEIATRCAANSVTCSCSSECRRRASTQTINCWSIYTRIARPRPFTRMQRRRANETSPPEISASGCGHCRASVSLALCLGTSLPDAAGAPDRRLCPRRPSAGAQHRFNVLFGRIR